jgi:hypothetical protein
MRSLNFVMRGSCAFGCSTVLSSKLKFTSVHAPEFVISKTEGAFYQGPSVFMC